MLRGYDIDGVLTIGIQPIEPYVIVSGRTFSEYNDFAKKLATSAPLYIRGVGQYGDREDAGKFKAKMINFLGIREFYEDDPVQLNIIKAECPNCLVYILTIFS
jgi:hypothetical protein